MRQTFSKLQFCLLLVIFLLSPDKNIFCQSDFEEEDHNLAAVMISDMISYKLNETNDNESNDYNILSKKNQTEIFNIAKQLLESSSSNNTTTTEDFLPLEEETNPIEALKEETIPIADVNLEVENEIIKNDTGIENIENSTKILKEDESYLNASFWQLFKQQVKNDFAPFILILSIIVPKPIQIFLISQFREVSHVLSLSLKGALGPMLVTAGRVLSSFGSVVIKFGDHLVSIGKEDTTVKIINNNVVNDRIEESNNTHKNDDIKISVEVTEDGEHDENSDSELEIIEI